MSPAWIVLMSFCAGADPALDRHPVGEWVRQSPRPGAPIPRFGWEGSGAYDPAGRRWIHWGGHDGNPQGFALFTFDLGSGAWEQHFPPTSPPGVCCVDGANVFDQASGRFVRFPGASLGHGSQWSRGVKLKYSHVWLYDPASTTWTSMRPAPYHTLTGRDALGRLNAGGTYDPSNELALSFGGQTSAGSTSNLFAYDAHANHLYRLRGENPPSPRDGMGIVYDPGNECLVVFGSQYSDDGKTYIYRYHTNKWEAHDLTPRPPTTRKTYSSIPKMAYDPESGLCLCVVWDSTGTGRELGHETWAFDAGKLQWKKLSPRTEPAPSLSRSRNLDYVPERRLFLLETVSSRGPELWSYRPEGSASSKPPAPRGLKVLTEKDSARLSWEPVAGAARYRVERAQAQEPFRAVFRELATVSETALVDRGLLPGQIYHYRVTAVMEDGRKGRASFRTRTQPRVLPAPVVSVTGPEQVELSWSPHPADDIVGYNIYRGLAQVRCVTRGEKKAWRDNDPEYSEPIPVEVRDIIELRRLNDQPLTATTWTDRVTLTRKSPEPGEYRYEVYAYIIRAVNRLGTESGPSPYALTIPSEPLNVLVREKGPLAELKWDPSPEKGIKGYHVYGLEGAWGIVRLTDEILREPHFTHTPGGTTRYWVVAVDALGQPGQPSSPAWFGHRYDGFFKGEWHQ